MKNIWLKKKFYEITSLRAVPSTNSYIGHHATADNESDALTLMTSYLFIAANDPFTTECRVTLSEWKFTTVPFMKPREIGSVHLSGHDLNTAEANAVMLRFAHDWQNGKL